MNQLKVGAIISYIALFLNIIIGLLYTPWMINSIGKSEYGLYTLAMSVISLFVFDFGLGSAITRFVSKFLAEKRQDKVDSLLGLVFKLYLLGDLFILISIIVIYFLLPFLYQGLTLSEMEDFKVVYLIAALFCVISFPFIPLNGIITSYEKFIQLKLCDLAHKIIVVVLMAVCLVMGGGLYALVIVNSVAGILVIFLKLYVLGKDRIKAIQWTYWEKQLLRSVLGFSIWVTIIQLAQRCIFNIAPSILAAFSDSQSITILGVAICLEGYTFSFANAINGMFLPKVSRLIADDKRSDILDLMIRVARIQIYIVGALCVGFICVGEHFVCIWLGSSFSEVYVCSLLLILPSFIQLPQEIGNTTVVAEGKVKIQAFAFIGMAVVNLILAYPLTKCFGVIGLCISIMIAYIFRTILMDYIFYKHLKIDICCFFLNSYIKIVPILVISTFISHTLCNLISDAGWFGFFIKVFICGSLYIISIWFFSMNKDEKYIILSPFLKLLK